MGKGGFAKGVATLAKRFTRVLTAHPVELVVLMHATASCIVSGLHWWELAAWYAPFATVAALCLSQWRERWHTAKWIYWAVLPLYAACCLLPAEWQRTTAYGILVAMLPAIYLIASGKTSSDGFGARLLSLVRSTAVAVGIGGLLCLLIVAIYYSTEALFDFTWRNSESVIFSVAFVLLTPLVFIGMEDAGGEASATKLEDAVANYVLTPALLIYNVVLYVYLVWIVVRWQLPEGSVSTMVCVFGAVAMGVTWLRPRLQKKPMEWYFRWFGLIALPVVALLWVAVSYRVAEYGLTVDRCLLIGVGAVLTVYTLLSLFRLRWVAYGSTALIVLLGVVLAVGGPLSARQLSVRSQLGIARSYADKIGLLNADGTLIKPTDQLADSLHRVEIRAVYQAMYYLQSDLGDTTVCREQLGMTTGDFLEGLSRSTFNYATAWRPERYDPEEDEIEPMERSYYLWNTSPEEIDISGYSRMIADVPFNKGRVPVPDGSLSADSVLATQLALIGYTLRSNLEQETLNANKDKLLFYRSPDDSLIVVFDNMTIETGKNGCYINSATVRYALKK